MEMLLDRIREKGRVLPGNVLKVDSFINHQMDIGLFNEMGKEFAHRYDGMGINKIVTIEASGIGIACIVAQHFDVPVVFAKKAKTSNIPDGVYCQKVESFTHKKTYDIMISEELLNENDRVLIIDDFLARGNALIGLKELIAQSGATVVGAGIVIEKGFQEGGKLVRESGLRVESLAIVEAMDASTGEILFKKQ